MTVPMVFVCAVWGEDYVRRWLDWSLPSLLSPGNLPACRPERFVVVTRPGDWRAMQGHPAFKALCQITQVCFPDTGMDFDGRDDMTAAHQLGLRWAKGFADDPAICFLNADLIVADGTYATVRRHLEAGKRAVLTQGISVNEAKFTTGLDPERVWSPLSLIGRTKYATDNWSTLPRWTPPFPEHPSQLFFPSGDSLVMHCWHLCPLAIRTGNIDTLTGTIDNDLTERCCEFDEIAFIQDSRDGCLVSLEADTSKAWGNRLGLPSVERVGSWARLCSPMQRRFFALPFTFGSVKPELIEEARNTVDAILAYGERPHKPEGTSLKALFITTRTNEVDGHVSAWDSFNTVPCERITFDHNGLDNGWLLVDRAREIKPDVIFYIGACNAPGNPKAATFRELRTIAPLVNVVSDAADRPWHIPLKRYAEQGCFDLQVAIDGAHDAPLDHSTLTPVDIRVFESIPDGPRDIRCGFSGSVGRFNPRAEIVTPLEMLGGLTVRKRSGDGGYSDHAAFLKRCRMLLNVSFTGSGDRHHIKGRALEAGWAGCCLLEHKDSIIARWLPSDCYLTYSDVREAARIIADTPDEVIERTAKRLSDEIRSRFHPALIYGGILSRIRLVDSAKPSQAA